MKKLKLAIPLCTLAIAFVVANCGDANPTSPSTAVPVASSGNLFGLPLRLDKIDLLECKPLASARGTKTIGRDGGEIHIGPHVFTVPAGALSRDVRITAEIVASGNNKIHFEPEGLTFAKPAILDISYANCPTIRSLLPKRVVYVNDNDRVLEINLSLDDLLHRRIKGKVLHFSDYAIAADEAFSDYSVGW